MRSSRIRSVGRISLRRVTLSRFRRGARTSLAASCSSKMNWLMVRFAPVLEPLGQSVRGQKDCFGNCGACQVGPVGENRCDGFSFGEPVQDRLDGDPGPFEREPAETNLRINHQVFAYFPRFHACVLAKVCNLSVRGNLRSLYHVKKYLACVTSPEKNHLQASTTTAHLDFLRCRHHGVVLQFEHWKLKLQA